MHKNPSQALKIINVLGAFYYARNSTATRFRLRGKMQKAIGVIQIKALLSTDTDHS